MGKTNIFGQIYLKLRIHFFSHTIIYIKKCSKLFFIDSLKLGVRGKLPPPLPPPLEGPDSKSQFLPCSIFTTLILQFRTDHSRK